MTHFVAVVKNEMKNAFFHELIEVFSYQFRLYCTFEMSRPNRDWWCCWREIINGGVVEEEIGE